MESEDEMSGANDSSDGEEDNLEAQLDSDTELEVLSDDEDYLNDVGDIVFGRDRQTKWNLESPAQNAETSAHDVSQLRGVRGSAEHAKSVLTCWSSFFDDKLLNIIVENTNKYINSKRLMYNRERECRLTDLAEIKAFIGLLYMAGYHRNSKLTTNEFWDTSGSGIELFRLTMSQNRFHFLVQCIHFDDKETRDERLTTDKLAPIREVLDMFVSHCKSNYSVGEYVTIDRMLLPYKGKCSFRQYFSNMPSKYGIKIISLVDSTVFYTGNLEVYVGVQPNGPYKLDYSSSSVVKRLCEDIRGTGRNITADKWFTSYKLINELKENYTLTYVGNVKKSERELPSSFVTINGRETFTSKFAFQKNVTLVSYVPEDGKNVLLLSSMHHDSAIDPSTNEQKIPEILSFYNNTKSSVEVVDNLCATYSVSRISNRWPMVLFYTMLNIGAINAYIIHEENKNKGIKNRRHFIKTLALALTHEHIKKRSAIVCLPRELRKRTSELIAQNNFDIAGTSTGDFKVEIKVEEICGEAPGVQRKRCYICDRKKNRKTKYRCVKCTKYICLQHADFLCQICNSEME